jgi:membrane fusion protein (multidrug efflux system)
MIGPQCDQLSYGGNKRELTIKARVFDKLGKGVILALVPLILFGCGSAKREQSRARNGADAVSGNVVSVEVAVAERRDLLVAKTYSGTLEGEEQANIVAKIPERITSIKVGVGESVRSGQVIVTLDKSGTSSQYYQAEASFRNAEKTLERMRSLYNEGAISLQSLDGTQTAYDVAKANFDAARNAVELTTPISGTVTAINVSTGDLAAPGSALVTIANIGRMKIIFNISESDVTSLSIGHKVQVHSDMRPEVKVDGRIVQLSKSADVRSRSFEIKAMFPNTSDKWFRPGMFCKVDVQIAPVAKALVIPSAAIQSDGVTNRVFVVRNGRALQRSVQVGIKDGENTGIPLGLSEGDTVATVGVNNLRDSSFVSVVSPSNDRSGSTR